MSRYLSDEEFIEAWKQLGSPQLVADALGLNIRAVYSRRKTLESKLDVHLPSFNDQSNRDKMVITEHKARINLNIQNGKILVFSDAHYWPNIISTGHRALLKFIEHIKPEYIICNGDAFDGPTISRYPASGWQNLPSVSAELKAVEERLGEIEQLSKGKLIWTLGNHDARFEAKVANSIPEFRAVKGFSLKERFLRWLPCWSVLVNDDTVIKHRWKGGIHATRNNTLHGGVNFITGHLHSLRVSPYSDYTGTRYGVDTGCLAAPYGPQFTDYTEDNPVDWRQGFVLLTFHKGQLLMPELIMVRDDESGEIEFRGAIDYV